MSRVGERFVAESHAARAVWGSTVLACVQDNGGLYGEFRKVDPRTGFPVGRRWVLRWTDVLMAPMREEKAS